jgi:hypothetical protein
VTRPSPVSFFRQSLKSDAFYSDEIINIYLLRPLAAVIVWILYPTRTTPNQVTLASILVGLAAGAAYLAGSPAAVALGGVLVVAKDILDDTDGQLARAKALYSRRGRFLDSIGDFVVDLAVFAAITWVVYCEYPSLWTILSGVLSLMGITLRVSYHVYYQVSFLHRQDRYRLNRIVETVTEEDRRGDPLALRLQQLFLLIYGWQDLLMQNIDRFSFGGSIPEEASARWYADHAGLRFSGLLGFGTELALLALCSAAGQLRLYLSLNLSLMNGIWLASIFYRRLILAPRLRQPGA